MLLLLACAGEPEPSDVDTATVARTPTPGVYGVDVAGAWVGDCDFADPENGQAPHQEWTVDPRGDVLVLYLDYWSVDACSLADLDFSCDDGSWSANRMDVTRLVEGTFGDDDSVSGNLVVELDCGGAGCDTLQDLYGRRLEFPCRSEAPFQGALQ